MNVRRLATVLLFTSFSSISQGEIYRWEEANGATHFSDKPPKNQPYEALDEQPTHINEMPESIPAPKKIEKSVSEIQTPSETTLPEKPEELGITACASLNLELKTVQRTEPVYKDNQGRFHTHRSFFSSLYEGRREYIEDANRDLVIERLKEKFSTGCANHTDDSGNALAETEWQIIQYRDCSLLDRHYENRQRPQYHTSHTDLTTLKKKIEKYCAESTPKPPWRNLLDQFGPDNFPTNYTR